jgi:hypothetical protein
VAMPRNGQGGGSRTYKSTALSQTREMDRMATKKVFTLITDPLPRNVADLAGAGSAPAGEGLCFKPGLMLAATASKGEHAHKLGRLVGLVRQTGRCW